MEGGLKKELFAKYDFGDMQVRYIKDEREGMELVIIPLEKEKDLTGYKLSRGESLIQAKLLGDKYCGSVGSGTTMRNSETTENLKFVEQTVINTTWSADENSKTIPKTVVKTTMTDGKKHLFIHYLGYTEGDYSFDSYTEFVNEDKDVATIEMLSSFSLSEITPFIDGEAPNTLKLHRIRSKWSHEGRLVSESAEDLQLEVTWAGWHSNSVRYGTLGSMPVRTYSPFGAVEDSVSGIVWGAQLMIESSWQMEFYRRDEALAFSGGLADREFGEWKKTIGPGERFETPVAIISVCSDKDKSDIISGNQTGNYVKTTGTSRIDYIGQRMAHYVNKYVNAGPESEQHLPVMFNEYCTTWGLPSYENIDGILNAIRGHGLEYFVIDCGWFVEEGVDWGNAMGDYIPSDILFPNGLKAMMARIKEEGLKPGIWFEIDNVGPDAHVYAQTEMFHTREGVTLATGNRRFFDMRKPEVIEYLDEKVIRQLVDNGFEYMKMDYNDTIGLGVDSYCDGERDTSVSLGEGLRADRVASVEFIKRVKEKVPGIILENCASGGHKLEPLMMSICSMASFSDAHECEHIPSVAGYLHRTILPRQSQIWAVIRKEASLKRIGWLLISSLLGRMCFSGDVTQLSDAQWNAIDKGIAFYKEASYIIKNGYTYIFDNKGASDSLLTGWQGFVRVKTRPDTLDTMDSDAALVTAFAYEYKDEIRIKLPQDCPKTIYKLYSTTEVSAEIKGDELVIRPSCGVMEAVALMLK